MIGQRSQTKDYTRKQKATPDLIQYNFICLHILIIVYKKTYPVDFKGVQITS